MLVWLLCLRFCIVWLVLVLMFPEFLGCCGFVGVFVWILLVVCALVYVDLVVLLACGLGLDVGCFACVELFCTAVGVGGGFLWFVILRYGVLFWCFMVILLLRVAGCVVWVLLLIWLL